MLSKKIIAIMLIITQVAYFLPAQEGMYDIRRGRMRLEVYLDRASVERSAASWERVAAAGLEAALMEWESANVYLKEREPELYEKMKSSAAGIYGLEKEKAYIEWQSLRVYAEEAKEEGSALWQALRQAALEWEYEREDGTVTRQVNKDEAGSVREAWERVALEIIERHLQEWESKHAQVYSELRERFAQAGIEEAVLEEIYGKAGEEYRGYVKGEYARIAAAEGNHLMRMLLHDSASLKRISASEAAGVIARQLSEEARTITAQDMERLFSELELQIRLSEQEGVEVDSSDWLASFRQAFEEGMAKWDAAELSFLAARAEWERNAEGTYWEGEKVWAQAYEQLEETRLSWERELIERIEQESREWEQRQRLLWAELEEARQEMAMIMTERRDNKRKQIEAQVTIYNRSRELIELAGNGIAFWYEQWGEEYRLYEKKYNELFSSQGPPGYEAGYIGSVLERPDMNELTGAGYEKLKGQLELLKQLYEEVNEKNVKIEEEEKFLDSIQDLIDEDRGWLILAKKYREEADNAVIQIYQQSGVNINLMTMEGYTSELASEILKAQALFEYWQGELYVAAALEEYARRYDSGLESAGETEEELKKAKSDYDKALAAYETALEALRGKEGVILTAEAAYESAEAQMSVLREALQSARDRYARIMAVINGVETGYIVEEIVREIEKLNTSRKEQEAAYSRYMAAVAAYGYAEHAASLASEVALLQAVDESNKTITYLNKKIEGIKEAANINLIEADFRELLGSELMSERELLAMLFEEYEKETDAAVKGRIETAIKAIWKSAEKYYTAQVEEMKRAAQYLLGDETLKTLSVEEKKYMELESWLKGQLAGIEAEMEVALPSESASLRTMHGMLNDLLGKSGKDLFDEVNVKRNKIEMVDILEGSMLSASSYGIAWAEYKTAREELGLVEAEGNERIRLTYDSLKTVSVNKADRQSREDIAKLKIAFEYDGGYKSKSIEDISKYIANLREASKGLNYAGRVALEEYIQGILEYAAIRDESEAVAVNAEAAAKAYEKAMETYETVIGWYDAVTLKSALEYLPVLGSEEFGKLEEKEKEALIRFGAALILKELSAEEMAESKNFSLFEAMVEDLALSWVTAYSGLEEDIRKSLYVQVEDIHFGRYGTADYSSELEKYAKWHKDMQAAAGDIVREKLLYEKVKENPVLSAWYRSFEFIEMYNVYLAPGDGEFEQKYGLTPGEIFQTEPFESFFKLAEKDENYKSNKDREWYSYYLAGSEMLYTFLSSPQGIRYIPEALNYFENKDKGLADRLISVYKVEMRAVQYNVLLDGDVKGWIELQSNLGWQLKSDDPELIKLSNLSVEEEKQLYEKMVYGEYRSGLEYYNDMELNLRSGSGNVLFNIVQEELSNVLSVIYSASQRVLKEVYAAQAMDQYLKNREQEKENKRVSGIIKSSADSIIKNWTTLDDKQKSVIETIADDDYRKRLERAEERIKRASSGLEYNEGSEYVYSDTENESIDLSEKKDKLEAGEYQYYYVTWLEEYHTGRLELLMQQYKQSRMDAAALTKEKDRLKEELDAALGSLKDYSENGYKNAVDGIKTAYNNYNTAVTALNGKHQELNEARLEVRKRQEIYDWAQSVYLGTFGNNSLLDYETPLEKLNKVKYAHERANISVEVLQSISSGNPMENAQYAKAMEAYVQKTKEYYAGLAAAFEADRAIAQQREILAQAEYEEYKARSKLMESTSLSGGKYEVPYVPAPSDWIKQHTGIEDLDGYFKDETEVRYTARGEEYNITKAEAETIEWLMRLELKQGEYFNDLMLAAVYMNLSFGSGNAQQKWYGADLESSIIGGLDPNVNGNYGINGITKIGPANFEEEYKIYRLSELAKAYVKISTAEGGLEDLARYLLYRDTTLMGRTGGADKEKDVLQERALNGLISRANKLRDDYKIAEIVNYVALNFPAAIYATLTRKKYEEAIKEFQDIRGGITKNKTTADDELAKKLADWIGKYRKAEEERDRLNTMLYGTPKPPQETGRLEYEQFEKGCKLLFSIGLQGFTVEDAQKLYTEKLFKDSEAGKEATIPEAIEAMNRYILTGQRIASQELKAHETALRQEQLEAQQAYVKHVTAQQEISGSDKARLKALAERASNTMISVAERDEAKEEYDVLFNKILSAESARHELTSLAQKAWGTGTWNSYVQDMEMIKLTSGLFNDERVRYERSGEGYTQWAVQQAAEAVLAAETNRNRLEYEREVERLRLIQEDFIRQREAWNLQAYHIMQAGAQEWKKAQGKLNEGANRWRRDFVLEYEKKTGEWEENYKEFVLEKQDWIETQYMYAMNVGNSELLEHSGVDPSEAIARVMEGARIERMSREEFDVKEYVDELISGTNLAALLAQSVNLTGRAQYGASAVHKGNVRSTAIENLTAAKVTQDRLNEALRVEAARLAASVAEKQITEAVKSYMERIDTENENMWKWQLELVRGSGYNVSGREISRNAVVDSTIWSVERKRQTVHAYVNFKTDAPAVELSRLDGLSSETITQMVNQVRYELKKWGERIFGVPEEDEEETDEIKPAGKFDEMFDNLLKEADKLRSSSELEELEKRWQELRKEQRKEEGDSPDVYRGEFGKHIGKAPEFQEGEDLKLKESRESNIKKQGEGEIGKILLDFQWNAMQSSAGWAEVAKPFYDQKMWRSNGKLTPLTVRGAMDIVGTVVGAVVGAIVGAICGPLGALASFLINVSDDLLFAVMDTTVTDKDNKTVWAEFGKKTAISAVTSAMSMGIGAAGDAAATAMEGSSAFAQAAVQGTISAVGSYTTSVATTFLQALDFRTGEMDWEMANKSWYSANTIAGMLGAGVTGGLSAINTGVNANKLLGFSGTNKQDVGRLNNLIGGVVEQGVNFAMGGDFTLNVLNLGLFTGGKYNSGLLEMHLGRNGMSMNFGTGGLNVSIDNIKGAVEGAKVWNVNNRIATYTENNAFKSNIALRAQYGYGDSTQVGQLWDILNGNTILNVGAYGDYNALTTLNGGNRVVDIGYRDGMSAEEQFLLAVVLGHEAHRDGIVSGDNYLETRTATQAHTEMALRMILGGEKVAFNANLYNDIMAYSMGSNFFNFYVDSIYDSSEDYWKLMNDGRLIDDERKSLYRETKYGDGEFLIWDLEMLDEETSFSRIFNVDENGNATFSSGALTRIGLYELLNEASNITESKFADIASRLTQYGNMGYYVDFSVLKDDMKYSDNPQTIGRYGTVTPPSDELIFNPMGLLSTASVFGTLSFAAGFSYNLSESPFYKGVQQNNVEVLRDTTSTLNPNENNINNARVVNKSDAPPVSGKPQSVIIRPNPAISVIGNYESGAGFAGGVNMVGQFISGTQQGISVNSVGVPQWEFQGVKFFSMWEPQLTGVGGSSFNYTPQFLSFPEAIYRGYPQKVYNYMNMPSGTSKSWTSFWNNLTGWR